MFNFRTAATAAALFLASAGSAAAQVDGPHLNVWLVKGKQAPPVIYERHCVIKTPALNAGEAAFDSKPPATTVFEHIGKSARECFAGKAKAASGEPPKAIFKGPVRLQPYIQCAPGDLKTCKAKGPAGGGRDEQRENIMGGHRVWHSAAGNYH